MFMSFLIFYNQYTTTKYRKQALFSIIFKKMHKKTLINQRFLIFFVLSLFFLASGCSKYQENCEFRPEFDLKSESLSESLDGIVQIEQILAKSRCNF
ncbi:MAG: hypothetical protein CBC09_00620 [Cellvibrionales bacterium TMED49]|nr:MAG: hypothetical protein CBC09_00620 [Cellvibrionales bacterium TMED49]